MNETPRSDSPNDDGGYPSAAVAWYTVAVLSVVYMFSFIDRQILVLLIEPIKHDLQISDTQVSLLTGAAFAVLYSIMGVPMGRAADRWTRRGVIAVGVAIWSVMTIGCGFARSFWQVFVARMGVGVGEAALTPTGHAIVADVFPPHRLARGMAAWPW
jgi:MFS family permease